MDSPPEFRFDAALTQDPGSAWTSFASARARFFDDLDRQSALASAGRARSGAAATDLRDRATPTTPAVPDPMDS